MASPHPSPRGDMSTPTSPQLTPRSKLKAMLAAVDGDSSDDEVRGPIDVKTLFAAIDENKQKLNRPSSADTDEDDDEDTEIIRPRGRLAARMHANFSNAKDASKSFSATQRAKQDKTGSSSSEERNIAGGLSHDSKGDDDEERNNKEQEAEEDEDEDDIVAPSRRRLVTDRGSTPEPAIQADRHSSPGLFVSPSPSHTAVLTNNSMSPDSEDDDLPTDLSKSARFKALVEKKRKERLDREADEERKRIERAQRMGERISSDSDANGDDVSDISDDAGGRKLTQDVSRPARKASKKALEEMNRETQRLSRSLQLSHEVKTKKKISKASLFQRFNFRAQGSIPENEKKQTGSSRPTTPGSIPQTDAELENNGTPPSSLPTSPKPVLNKLASATSPSKLCQRPLEDENDGLGDDMTELQATKTAPQISTTELPATKALSRRFRVKVPPAPTDTDMVDIDEELEIMNPIKKDKLEVVFARIPENKLKESTEMKILRNLAHLSSPPREQVNNRNTKSSMTLGELQLSLQQRAKAQAKLERERHLESLRAKGIVVRSAEERQREEEQIEDIVARARQEVEEIMLREREEAKENRKKQGRGADPLAWDDSDEGSSYENQPDDDNEDEVELSGSEDDQQEKDDDDLCEAGDEEMGDADQVVSMDDEEVQPEVEEALKSVSDFSDDDIEAMKHSTARQSRRSKKHVQIISDEEDEEVSVEATPRPKRILPKSPSMPGSGSSKFKTPTSVLRSATKTFIPGLPIAPAAPAGLGLTQIFAGTMDDSDAGSLNGSPTEFMPSIDQFPDSQFSATAGNSQHNGLVSDSQPAHLADSPLESQTQGLQLHYTQSQAHALDSLMEEDSSQMFGFVEPTQDGGFQDFTPLKQRFIDPPQSTTSTVVLTSTQDDAIIQESPLARKRGKLIRRIDFAKSSSTFSSEQIPPKRPNWGSVIETDGLSENTSATPDAFNLMEKATKREKRIKKFDKKKSKANEMVEVQAEESEDEYAGLGGADGEDSSDEDKELDKQMIDDSGENEWDAAKLAGIFADQDRAADAAQVDKLFRDITSGMLRKRRRGGDGHDFDLSDSDDGGEARRRMKRRQFAKMQKALFADERVGKIAENPRTAAFLKSMEDMRDNDEWDFCDNFADTTSTSGDDSQSQNAARTDQAIPNSQPSTTHRKRPRTADHDLRPNPNERRTKEGAAPSSITEVRRSLSTLLDEHNASAESIIPGTDVGSDSDEEKERPLTSPSNKENRRSRHPANGAVVDRISLKRNNSSSLSTSNTSANARLAFTAPSNSGSGFKVPNLLRRATTNSTMLSSSSKDSTTSATTSYTSQASTGGKSSMLNKAADFGDDGKLKKTAGKRSGINYFAHENERRAKVADAEKRREAKKWKGAEGRSKVVGSLFGSGSFE